MCEALMELMRPEYEAGMKMAKEQGMKQVLFDLVSSGKLDVSVASETLGITPEEFTKKFKAAKV